LKEFEELKIESLIDFIKEGTEYQTAQYRMCFPIIKRMYRRIKMGYCFGGVKICKDKGIVVDGNHRYIAYLLAQKEVEFILGRSSFCDKVVEYNKIEFITDQDWDENSEDTRKFLNDDFLKEYKIG